MMIMVDQSLQWYASALPDLLLFLNNKLLCCLANQLADGSCNSLDPSIAGVSVVQDIFVYLLNKGWKRIALFYEMHTTHELFNSLKKGKASLKI